MPNLELYRLVELRITDKNWKGLEWVLSPDFNANTLLTACIGLFLGYLLIAMFVEKYADVLKNAIKNAWQPGLWMAAFARAAGRAAVCAQNPKKIEWHRQKLSKHNLSRRTLCESLPKQKNSLKKGHTRPKPQLKRPIKTTEYKQDTKLIRPRSVNPLQLNQSEDIPEYFPSASPPPLKATWWEGDKVPSRLPSPLHLSKGWDGEQLDNFQLDSFRLDSDSDQDEEEGSLSWPIPYVQNPFEERSSTGLVPRPPLRLPKSAIKPHRAGIIGRSILQGGWDQSFSMTEPKKLHLEDSSDGWESDADGCPPQPLMGQNGFKPDTVFRSLQFEKSRFASKLKEWGEGPYQWKESSREPAHAESPTDQWIENRIEPMCVSHESRPQRCPAAPLLAVRRQIKAWVD